jgi:hypothetical protein
VISAAYSSFEPEADLLGIAAAAGGALAATVTDPADLPAVLKEAPAVQVGRSAVAAAHLPPPAPKPPRSTSNMAFPSSWRRKRHIPAWISGYPQELSTD